MTTATVFIVDDDLSFLKSLGRLIRSAGFSAATFCSAREFLRSPKTDTPACMIMDMQMPELCGFDLHQKMKAEGWLLPVIFLTGYGDIPMSVRAIKAGAVDFLTKPCAENELLGAIKHAIEIDIQGRQSLKEMAELKSRFSMLTRRELEVLGHVIEGRLNKQIAYDLGTCEQTIKVHRMRITEKLEVRSLAELVRLSEKAGILPCKPIN